MNCVGAGRDSISDFAGMIALPAWLNLAPIRRNTKEDDKVGRRTESSNVEDSGAAAEWADAGAMASALTAIAPIGELVFSRHRPSTALLNGGAARVCRAA